MWSLRFVLDLPPTASSVPDPTDPGPLPPDLLAFDADAAFTEWSERFAASGLLHPRPWGSAFSDDPWPMRLPAELHPAVQAALRERFAAQAPSVPRSLTWRSVNSSSHVRLEAHDTALVVHVTVTPRDPQPRDESSLPSDLAALLQPLPLLQEADLLLATAPLTGALEEPPQSLLPARRALQQLGALWYDDLRLLDVLRLCANHPQSSVRASVMAVASQVGFRLFLLECAAEERDPLLARVLKTVTAWSPPEATQESGA